ncbi:MAG: hypothetical protein ACKVSF_01765 [Alphaproteobacteria bacterium]
MKPLGDEVIDGPEALARYLDHHGAFITHRSLAGYVQMKTRVHLSELLKEKRFYNAFERARWDGYVAVVGDLSLIAWGYLRGAEQQGAAATLDAAIVAVHDRVLSGHRAPAHLPEGWSPACAAFGARIGQARFAPPRQAGEVAYASGNAIFDALPIHVDLRKWDRDSVVGGVRFLVVSAVQPLSRLIRPAPLLAALLAGQARPPSE